MVSMECLEFCRVFIVLELVSGVHDSFCYSEESQSRLLKFLTFG